MSLEVDGGFGFKEVPASDNTSELARNLVKSSNTDKYQNTTH